MAGNLSRGGPIAGINITPFVDVVLVLLVTLMLTSQELARRSFQLDLPTAAHGGEAVPRTLNLVLDAEGVLHVDGEPAPREGLGALLEGRVAEYPELRAVIAADQALPYRDLIALIDIVKGHGISAFALDVVPGAQP